MRIKSQDPANVNLSISRMKVYSSGLSLSVQYFQRWLNIAGLAFNKSSKFAAASSMGMVLSKKSAFSNGSCNKIGLNLATRMSNVLRASETHVSYLSSISARRASMRHVSCIMNLNRIGIPLLCPSNVLILSYRLSSYFGISFTTKSINSSGSTNISTMRMLTLM